MGDAQGTAGTPAWSGLGWDGAFQTLFFLQMFGAAPQGSGGGSTPQSSGNEWMWLGGCAGIQPKVFPSLADSVVLRSLPHYTPCLCPSSWRTSMCSCRTGDGNILCFSKGKHTVSVWGLIFIHPLHGSCSEYNDQERSEVGWD